MNIELLTLSEVAEVTGQAGNFSVTIKQSPRYIDPSKCIACNLCAEKCPVKVDDDYNLGLVKRKAAYIKYGQTVPLKYAIDGPKCIYLLKGKCGACEKFCPTGAINFKDQESHRTLDVGSVILAPGFKPFDPSIFDFYGYGRIPDVITGLEYERMLSPGGPLQGHLQRPSDQREPRRIAWIQCVGSRNTNRCNNAYCSSVCCMYAVKQALITGEHLTIGDQARQTIFYMDIRSHGKKFERYYEGAKAQGVQFLRARPHTILPGKNNIGVKIGYTTEDGRQQQADFDLVVLSIGLETAPETMILASKFGIELTPFHFARTSSFDPVACSRSGVFVAGAFQAAKAIPGSVTESSAAAEGAGRALVSVRGALAHRKKYPAEKVLAAEPRIGVFVCSCGINIAGVVDVAKVADHARSLPDVLFVENNLFTCSTDTQALITEKIREHDLNRIVVAACSPRTHEPLFQETLKEAGINAHLVEMANIRNHNSWVHKNESANATRKAMDQVSMAVARVRLNSALHPQSVAVVQQALVVGGGIAGMNAALAFAEQGYPVTLVEKSDELGGNAWHIESTWRGEDVHAWLKQTIGQIEAHPQITLYRNAQVKTVSGSVGNFSSTVDVDGREKTVRYGAVVLATGAQEYQPQEYLYGQHERVMTRLQFDDEIRLRPVSVKAAESVVFIQCVGSRETQRQYCSRVCCTHSVSAAIKLKQMNPDMQVYILNRDVRTYGIREQLYKQARDAGVLFIRYEQADKPQVSRAGNDLRVDVFDPILQRPLRITADYLVLAAAIVPTENNYLNDLYKCALNQDGFLNEAHPKLRPVETSVDGVFLAGLCNYPKPIEESIKQARAAVSRAGVILAREEMYLDAVKSQVTDNCDGCALCLDVCPYQALRLEPVAGASTPMARKIVSDSALCKGCGACEATCPKAGITVLGFTHEQLRAQVQAVLACK